MSAGTLARLLPILAADDDYFMTNPLAEIGDLYAGFAADDPLWTPPSVAYCDPTLGLVSPGVVGNYAWTSDVAALDITGDITLTAMVTPADWTDAAYVTPTSKRTETTQRSYVLRVNPTGYIEFAWTADGTTFAVVPSTYPVAFANGAPGRIAATLDVDNGAGGHDLTFWTSSDGVTWSKLGSTVTRVGTTSIYNSTSPVYFAAAITTSTPFVGSLQTVSIYSGSGFTTAGPSGTLVFHADFRRARCETFVCSTGQTVTIASGAAASDLPLRGTLAGNSLSQATSSKQGLYRGAWSLLNNVPVVDLDGTDDLWELLIGVSLSQPFSVLWVGTADVLPSRNMLGLLSTNAVGGMTASAGGAFYIGSGAVGITAGSASSVNTPYALLGVYNTTSSAIEQNGVSLATGTVGNFTADQLVLGAGRVAPATYSRFQNGQTYMVLIVPGDLRTKWYYPALRSYITRKTGIVFA